MRLFGGYFLFIAKYAEKLFLSETHNRLQAFFMETCHKIENEITNYRYRVHVEFFGQAPSALLLAAAKL